MSVASTTVSQGAFSDPRILYLAKLAGWEDGVDAAIGKLTRLWGRCTHLQTDVVPDYEVCACLGENGDTLLIKSGLGERADGGVRVKGRIDNATGRDRFSWFAAVAPKSKKAGGDARIANAARDPKTGRLLPSNAGVVLDQQRDQQEVQQPSNAQQVAISSTTSVLVDAGGAGSSDSLAGSSKPSKAQLQVQDQDPDLGSLSSSASPLSAEASSEPGAEHDRDPTPPAEPREDTPLPLPASWQPEHEPDLDEECRRLGVDLAFQLERFRNNAKGKERPDWQNSWRGWQLLAIKYARENGRKGAQPSGPSSAAIAARNRAELERERAENAERAAKAKADQAEVAADLARTLAANPYAKAAG